MRQSILALLASATNLILASPFPQQTTSSSPSPTPSADATSAAPSSLVTTAPGLTCTGDSTVLFTSDCTLGTPTSYCNAPLPPISCNEGYFPSVWHPGHCITQSTCFPVDASWITTECSNGGIAYSTTTLYQGTLAGGESTIISQVYCSCATDEYYSMTSDGTTVDTFCMPKSNCPAGMTTSTSTNEYCATEPPESCSDVPLTTEFCSCGPSSTAVYPSGCATPTGCAAMTTS